MTSSLHIAREVLKLPLLRMGLEGFGFSVLERDKPHYNIILMVLIRKEVISRNRKPPTPPNRNRGFQTMQRSNKRDSGQSPAKMPKNLILNH